MKHFSFIFSLVIVTISFSQHDKKPTYFGLNYRSIIPSTFTGSKTLSLTKDDYKVSLTQTLGHSFGVVVRSGITKLIAFETGIMYTARNFNVDMTFIDTTDVGFGNTLWNDRVNLRFINYEIPLSLLVYIKLTNEIYMNASLGVAIRFAPTGIGKTTTAIDLNYIENYGASIVGKRAGINFNANYGFEYRTKTSGFIYFGGSVCVPLGTFMNIQSNHYRSNEAGGKTYLVKSIAGAADGSYIGIDLKYFFPIIEKKGVQPLQGPIL
jgi:hypothetical protein